MAIWQYTFYLVPRNAYLSMPSPKKDCDGLIGIDIYWSSEEISCSFFNNIERILPKTKERNNEQLVFGDFESNVLTLICKNKKVATASFRINYTIDYEEILRELIEFFIFNALVVIDENLNEVPLNFESFKNTIETSPKIKKYNELLKRQDKHK